MDRREEKWYPLLPRAKSGSHKQRKIRPVRFAIDDLAAIFWSGFTPYGSPKTANPTDRAPWKKFEVAPREHPKIHEIKKARKRTGKSREMAGNRHGLCPDRSYGLLNLW